jgi:type III secretion system YscI/HrpB-like protein
MTLEAIHATAAATPSTLAEHVAPDAPSANDIDAFTRALLGTATQSPEAAATGRLQAVSAKTDAALDGARDTVDLTKDPREMFIAQSTLQHAIVEVDLLAKVAGGLSQGINKLTSMQ